MTDTIYDAATRAANRTARFVKRYGWDADDCRQEAVVVALDLEARGLLPDDPDEAGLYVGVAVRRAIVRRAAGRRSPEPLGDGAALAIPGRERAVGAVLEFEDLRRAAPDDVRAYVDGVLAGETQCETMRRLGVTWRQLKELRERAAGWLAERL